MGQNPYDPYPDRKPTLILTPSHIHMGTHLDLNIYTYTQLVLPITHRDLNIRRIGYVASEITKVH